MPRRAALGLLLASASTDLRAQVSWPSRPVRIVVPNPPGGINDSIARLVAGKLQARFGTPVIVENRAGANGIIANDVVAKSAPDGHTLLFATTGSLAINAFLYPDAPYDAAASFEPVSLLAITSSILAVHPSVPANSLSELIVYAQSRPGALNNSAGSTISQVAAEMFKQMAGVQITSVPYRGSAPAVLGLLAGETQMIIADTMTVLPHVQSGRLRALAVSWPRRLAELPEVRTFPEAGMPGYEFYAWLGLFVPAGTPALVVARLNAEINAALRQDDVARALGTSNEAVVAPPQALSDAFRRDLNRFARVIREGNIRAE